METEQTLQRHALKLASDLTQEVFRLHWRRRALESEQRSYEQLRELDGIKCHDARLSSFAQAMCRQSVGRAKELVHQLVEIEERLPTAQLEISRLEKYVAAKDGALMCPKCWTTREELVGLKSELGLLLKCPCCDFVFAETK